MIGYLSSRSPRERISLAAAAFLLICAGLYVALIEPLEKQHDRTVAQIASEREALDYVTLAGRQALALRESTSTIASLPEGETLMSILDRSARAVGIATTIKRIVPAGEREASVIFSGVGFDELVGWLASLDQDFGIKVTQLNANPSTNPGHAEASMILSVNGAAK